MGKTETDMVVVAATCANPIFTSTIARHTKPKHAMSICWFRKVNATDTRSQANLWSVGSSQALIIRACAIYLILRDCIGNKNISKIKCIAINHRKVSRPSDTGRFEACVDKTSVTKIIGNMNIPIKDFDSGNPCWGGRIASIKKNLHPVHAEELVW